MSDQPLNLARTLFDSDGYRHTLVRATSLQVLTALEGFYWLWDRSSGRCLMEGLAGTRLSNHRPAYRDTQEPRDPLAETRAFLIAQEAVLAAAASSSLSLRASEPLLRIAQPVSADPWPLPPAHVAAAPLPRPEPSLRSYEAMPVSAPPQRARRRSGFAAAVVMGLVGLALLLPGLRNATED
jgi:hypothetical protein